MFKNNQDSGDHTASMIADHWAMICIRCICYVQQGSISIKGSEHCWSNRLDFRSVVPIHFSKKTDQVRQERDTAMHHAHGLLMHNMAKDEHDMYTATWTPKLNPNGKQCYIWVHTNLLVSDETWTPPMLWWTEAELYNHTVFLANSHKKTESVWHWSWSSLCFWWMMRRIRTIEVTWCNNLI